MKLIDTHCHINLHAFSEDGAEVIQRALDLGVAVVNVGTELASSKEAVNLLDQFPENVYATVGLHPEHSYDHSFHDTTESEQKISAEVFDYEAYKKLASNPRVVGIGECGLDYYRLGDGNISDIKQKQRTAFEAQIKLAQELDKALCIHCRPSPKTNDAYKDTLEIMRGKNVRFEIHSFTGDLATAQAFIGLGAFIGLNAIITFDKTERSEQVVRGIPMESIVLETDAPYLAPAPHRGKRNEPAYVEYVARKIAEWKNVSFDEVALVSSANAGRLFLL